MKLIKYFALSMLGLFLVACAATKNEEEMTIASKQVDCTGSFPQKCFLVKTDKNRDWHNFYGTIEGFNYEPGYEYILSISKEPIEYKNGQIPADASSIKYRLIKELSKVKQDSQK